MQVDRVYYPVRSLGYGRRVGIWTIGCPHACYGCSNPELWEPDPTRDIPISSIFKMISSIKEMIDGITISGGEPFTQASALRELVTLIKHSISEDIIIYTGYTLEYLQQLKDESVNSILENTAVLIDGRYQDNLNNGLGLRGSTNQRVHILNPLYRDRLNYLEQGTRQVQNIFYNETVFSIGIPKRGFRDTISNKLTGRGVLQPPK